MSNTYNNTYNIYIINNSTPAKVTLGQKIIKIHTKKLVKSNKSISRRFKKNYEN